METELTYGAMQALINVGTNRQGAVVKGAPSWVVAELYSASLIGPDNGLTRTGTIKRERLVSNVLDAAFG